MRTAIVLVMAICAIQTRVSPPVRYDLAIAGGRVMEPETGLDAVRNVEGNLGPPGQEEMKRSLIGRPTAFAADGS
jgi:hypothetical protein